MSTMDRRSRRVYYFICFVFVLRARMDEDRYAALCMRLEPTACSPAPFADAHTDTDAHRHDHSHNARTHTHTHTHTHMHTCKYRVLPHASFKCCKHGHKHIRERRRGRRRRKSVEKRKKERERERGFY